MSEIVRRTTPLKLSLRSLHRMMQSSGTTEGLRNLIDSQIPRSLEQIFKNAVMVGAPVLAFGKLSGAPSNSLLPLCGSDSA